MKQKHVLIHRRKKKMATISIKSSTFITFALLFISGTLVSGQECSGDLQELINQCAMYVQSSGPSAACCNVVNNVDIPCVCNYMTPSVEQMIDMAKVVNAAAVCGKPLAHGTKCGSYTVP